MSTERKEVKGWEQLPMFPGEPVEIILRVGLMPSSNHAQMQLERHDGALRTLSLLESRPHVAIEDALDEIEHWVGRLRAVMRATVEPF